jgi:succinylglutamic semialdehyde dehydrogenase
MTFDGRLRIGGAAVTGEGAPFVSTAPATGEVLWSGRAAAPGDVARAAAAARDAFPAWAARPFEERASITRRFAERVAAERPALARLIARETGKPVWDADGEVGSMAAKVAVSIEAYHARTGTLEKPAGGATLHVAHRPHGVMAVLGPFNFPGHLPNGHIVPALLAGNTVVFKPSELTPAVAEMTADLWAQSGLPAGVLNLVQGGRETAEALVADRAVAGVAFTGGVPAGRAIHRALAGRPEVILALEMGGNAPIVVWDAGDLDAAARIVFRSAYVTSGQRCTCARRLIVRDGEEGRALVDRLSGLVDRVVVGAPEDEPPPFMGPVVSETAAQAVLAAQAGLVARGARPVRACRRLERGPAFLSPGLLDVTGLSGLPDEEVFGPLLTLARVADFDAALAVANDTRFGLAAGLVSDDPAVWARFSAGIRAGVVNWNRPTVGASGSAPFGGVGLSGNHRPAGYTAADYCAFPVASLVAPKVADEEPLIGVKPA